MYKCVYKCVIIHIYPKSDVANWQAWNHIFEIHKTHIYVFIHICIYVYIYIYIYVYVYIGM